MIIINPEFHRYLWLNFSLFRLIVMPFILALVIYLFSYEEWNMQYGLSGIFLPILWTYFTVVFIWGNYEAANASNREVGSNTWDFQKMSALGPWELVIGKLFGSTSYVWYSGLLLLVALVMAYIAPSEKRFPLEIFEVYPSPLKPVIYLLFAGVMGQATAFLLGLNNLKGFKTSTVFPFIMGMAVSFAVFSITIGFELKSEFLQEGNEVYWHAYTVDAHTFTICSLLFFFFWIMMAIQRNMRDELQYRNSPVILMLFLITMCLYATGLINNTMNSDVVSDAKIMTAKMFVSFLIILPCLYFTLLMEANNPDKYRRWLYAIQNREWKRIFENFPAWIACVCLILPVYVTMDASLQSLPVSQRFLSNGQISFFTFATSLLLFTARDGFMFHSILSGKIQRHKSFVLILYMLMIYGLAPFTILTLFDQSTEVQEQILSFFYPSAIADVTQACTGIFIQVAAAAIIWGYTSYSLRKRHKV